VAKGTYRPDRGALQTLGDRSASFALINQVELYGGFSGDGTETMLEERNSANNVTILSGDLAGDDNPADPPNSPDRAENSFHVLTAFNIDDSAILDGFTITGGNANGAEQPRDDRGGGLRNIGSFPTVRDCRFLKNFGVGFGGGVSNTVGSQATFENCQFEFNKALQSGGGMYNFSNSSVTLTGCLFSKNTADEYGGGMYNVADSFPESRDCEFRENQAGVGAAFGCGGAVSLLSGVTSDETVFSKFINCKLVKNIADCGGGAYIGDSPVDFTNVKFIGNEAVGTGSSAYGGAVWSSTTESIVPNFYRADFNNCLFDGNTARRRGVHPI